MNDQEKDRFIDSVVEKAIKIAGILAVVFSVMAIILLAIASSYSVMISDDFFFAQDTGRRINTFQYLAACWKHMAYEYMTWQGTYFSELFNTLFNPVNIGGFASLRIIMVINVLMTFFSFLFLIFTVLQFAFEKERWIRYILLGTAVFALAEYDVFQEIFFWYTGAMAVSIPFSLACLALAALVKSNHAKSRAWLVIASVLGFLAAGGSLSVGGTLCYLALVFISYYWIRDKKLIGKNILIFLFSFCGSLVNALAPGNFVRQGVESGNSVSILQTLVNVWKVYQGELEWLFRANNFGAVVCIIAICGILIGDKSLLNRVAALISGAFALFTPAVTIFPVVLGYRVPWIPNRCKLITTQMFIFCFGGLALILGIEIGKVLEKKRSMAVIGLLTAALVLVIISDLSPRSYRSVRIVKGLYDHTYQDNYSATRDLMDYLREHPGEDLAVDVPTYPEVVEYYYSFYLLDDEKDRINRAVSWAYDLNSIKSSREYGN